MSDNDEKKQKAYRTLDKLEAAIEAYMRKVIDAFKQEKIKMREKCTNKITRFVYGFKENQFWEFKRKFYYSPKGRINTDDYNTFKPSHLGQYNHYSGDDYVEMWTLEEDYYKNKAFFLENVAKEQSHRIPEVMSYEEVLETFSSEDMGAVERTPNSKDLKYGNSKGGRYWFDSGMGDHEKPTSLELLRALIGHSRHQQNLPLIVPKLTIKEARELYERRSNGYCVMDKETGLPKLYSGSILLDGELCLDELEAIYVLAKYAVSQRKKKNALF